MSQPPSATPAAQQQPAAVITPTHQRSLSEQSTNAGSVPLSVNSSYNGSLRSRRPAAGVTTVKKRRFRTQSSNVVGSRRANNTLAVSAVGDNGTVVSVHTRASAEHSVPKAASSDVVDANSSGTGTSGGSSSAKVKVNHNDAGTGVVFPKINNATTQHGVSRTGRAGDEAAAHDGDEANAAGSATAATTARPITLRASGEAAQRDLSASVPGNSHAIKKQVPSSFNRTAPPATVSAKELTHDPSASHELAEGNGAHKTSSTVSAASLRQRTSEVSFSSTVDDSVVLGSSKYRVSPPPRELSSLSHKESFKSTAAPASTAATATAAAPVSPVTAKPADATAAWSLGPLRGSTHVGGGNSVGSSNVKSAKDSLGGRGNNGGGNGGANADLATPPLSRRDSAVHVGAMHTPKLSPLGENAPGVSLPRVASQLPGQRTGSQLSPLSSPHASGAVLRSSGESALVESAHTSPPATQSLKTVNSTRSPRLQPHPPTTLHRTASNTPNNINNGGASPSPAPPPPALQSVQSVLASYPPERESKSNQPSRHASKLERSLLSKLGKSDHGVLLPAIITMHCTPIACRNFGATCYLNSVVQCLLHTPGLLRALDKDRQRIIKEWEAKKGGRFDEAHRRSCAERNAPATSALLDLGTSRPRQDTPASQLLLSLKAACGECNDEFAGNGQNDAHEFLITLLGVVDTEVCRSKPEAYRTMKDVEDECKRDAYARWTARLRQENDSTIYDYFGGVTGSTVQCASCSLISYRFEALLDISLPMAYNSSPRAAAALSGSASESKHGKPRPEEVVAVDLLLHDMFFSDRGEFLSGPMQVTCDRCKKLRDKTIWSTIEQWPPILVLHLKRFNNAGVKNESAVVFPYTFCPFGRVKYQLYGVCCHRGTASFGHYTSYVYTENETNTAADLPVRSSAAARNSGDQPEEMDAFRSPPSGSFARSVDGDLGDGEECDLPCGKNITPVKVQGNANANGGSSNSSSNIGGGALSRGGKWYLCNDESITTVTPAEVVSKTKEAYILFYRRVA